MDSHTNDSSRQRLLAVLLVAALYVAASIFTNAHFMADSGGYVVSILAYDGVDEYVAENPEAANFLAANSFLGLGSFPLASVGLGLVQALPSALESLRRPRSALNLMFL